MTSSEHPPVVYLSMPFPCSYLPGKEASNLFIDPERVVREDLYSILLLHGFRRSGSLFYRPHCDGCAACRPVRVPVREFKPNRSQRRVLEKNRDVTVTAKPAAHVDEQYELYLRYLAGRHPQSPMNRDEPKRYLDFFFSPHIDTVFYEFRLGRRLMAIAVTDILSNSLSAVYTYYDPDLLSRSPGTLAVLHQIQEARRIGLDFVYLGYWIPECRAMAYKNRFHPIEEEKAGCWSRVSPPTPA